MDRQQNDRMPQGMIDNTSRYLRIALVCAALLLGVRAQSAAAETYSVENWSDCPSVGSGDYDNAGNLYIACGSSIAVYDANGTRLNNINPGAGTLYDVEPSADGAHLYLARGDAAPRRMTRGGNGSYALDPTATWSLAKYPAPDAWMPNPMGEYIDSDNQENVYLSDGVWVSNGLNSIVKFNSSGAFITKFGQKVNDTVAGWNLGNFYGSPGGIAVKPDGTSVYVADINNSRIQRFDRQGNGSYVAASAFGNNASMQDARGGYCYPDGGAIRSRMAAPYGVALDDSGNIYVHNTTCAQLIKFSPQQEWMTTTGWSTPANQNHSWAVSKDGRRIYLPESQKLVRRTDSVPTIPDTAIDSGPSGSTTATSAQFTFSAAGTATGFECKLDAGAWGNCSSPKSYSNLGVGQHTFSVRALNASGTDQSPAAQTWTVTAPGGSNYGSADPGAAKPCDKWASPTGSNAAAGTQAAPYRNVAYLITHLAAGQTGCLASGARFNEPSGEFIVSSSAGTQANPITVRSADASNPAEIHAQMWLKPDADNINFRDLEFVGSPGSAKSVMLIIGGADGVGFYDNDITFRNGICFNVGALDESKTAADQTENSSDRFVLSGNRIHDCGADAVLTGADSGTHGVYLMHTRYALIDGNWIYDNKNRGVQLYPVARDSLIEHNLLDGNGSNLNLSSEVSQKPDYISSGNVARANLISNSVLRGRWDDNWPDADFTQVWGYGFGGPARGPNDAPTFGNEVTGNCIYQPDPAHNFGGWGYAQSGNTFADPGYENRVAKDFDLIAGGPCAGMGPGASDDPPQPAGLCQGFEPTLEGTEGADSNLRGGAGADVIAARGGGDNVYGLASADIICGEGGYDYIDGGTGSDIIDGGSDGANADYTSSPTAVDADVAAGTATAGGDTDQLMSLLDVTGSALDDEISGNDQGNYFEGGSGNDTLLGLGGNDALYGGPGNDRIVGGAGADRIRGGDGDDAVDTADGSTDTSVDCGPGQDTLTADAAEISGAIGCEVVNGQVVDPPVEPPVVPPVEPPVDDSACLNARSELAKAEATLKKLRAQIKKARGPRKAKLRKKAKRAAAAVGQARAKVDGECG